MPDIESGESTMTKCSKCNNEAEHDLIHVDRVSLRQLNRNYCDPHFIEELKGMLDYYEGEEDD